MCLTFDRVHPIITYLYTNTIKIKKKKYWETPAPVNASSTCSLRTGQISRAQKHGMSIEYRPHHLFCIPDHPEHSVTSNLQKGASF